ncbi:MAG: hypothetical protein AAGB31_14245 [Bdellovibrio sp.]
MKQLTIILALFGFIFQAQAQDHSHSMPHEMQHGFILSEDDTFGSHLVANGHHSRQVEIVGQLTVQDASELAFYKQRKESAINQSYFLFQAQKLDLPSLTAGKVLTGHIVESKVGGYEPKNIIVKSATFYVQKVLLNISNPFFGEETQHSSSSQPNRSSRQGSNYSNELLKSFKSEERHCCETGAKPCNWKC